MANFEYELATGLYLSNYKTPIDDVSFYSIRNEQLYLRYTDDFNKYIGLNESKLQQIFKNISPDAEVDIEDFCSALADRLVYRKAPIEGIKYEKNDGTFTYRLKDDGYVRTVPFLQNQNLSFEKKEDLEIIKSYQHLHWPNFPADQTELANLLKAKGYVLDHCGRSGLESQNSYYIELPNVDETNAREIIGRINKDIADAKEELHQNELTRADNEFAKNVLDEDGIFSYLELGGGPSDLHNYDTEKYQRLGSERIEACQDSRRNISHIYRVLLFAPKKLEESNKKVIKLSSAMGFNSNLTRVSSEYGINFKIGTMPNVSYIIDGHLIENASHLDLDLSNPKDVETALIQDKLSWPTINATSTILKEEMEKMGYVLEHQGRSGIARRNSYEIQTKDGLISPEVVEKITQDLEKAKLDVKKTKLANFDKYFDEQSTDKAKTYALVETGYDYDLTRLIDTDKYECVAKIRIANTADHRYGYAHTDLELLINEKRMKEDKRKTVVIEVPKAMIGKIIGSGGENIKALQQKYGNKHFKVVQDPKEIEAENKRLEEERIRNHQYELRSLQRDIQTFMGENFISADEESISVSMVEYIINNKDKLSFQPTQDEMIEMKQKLLAERDDLIKQENERKAAEIAYQKRLKEQKAAEQKRLENEKKIEIECVAKAHIQKYADEHNGAVISNKDFAKFMTETFKDDELAQKFTGSIQKDFLLKIEKERAVLKRFADAEENFEKVATEEYRRLRLGHYGLSIDIRERIAYRLGISDDLDYRQDRLIENWPQAGKIGSGTFPDHDFNNRLIAFEEAHQDDDFSTEQVIEDTDGASEDQELSKEKLFELALHFGGKIKR